MKTWLHNKPLAIGLGLLAIGQLLYFWDFTTLYFLALWYVLVIGLPYPAVFRSFVSRSVAALIMIFSMIQLMAALQFFIFPDSRFFVLSLLVSGSALAGMWMLRGKVPRGKLILWTRTDTAALVATLFFVLPLAGVCYWKNDPVHLAYVGGYQSPDGTAHYGAIAEMMGQQHLDYRTVSYYPKGFHLASAMVQHAFHATPPELSWVGNARVYFLLYIVWGAVLTWLLFYVAVQLIEALLPKRRISMSVYLLLACAFGPIMALLYGLPFVYYGFLNYYYVCAAIILGSAYLFGYRKAAGQEWRLVVYLLIAFGVAMSWGPLLTPPLILTPLLYLVARERVNLDMLRSLLRPKYWPIVVALVVQVVPLYLHLKYARLTSAQGINAQGIMRDLHIGLLLAGIGLLVWLLRAAKIPEVFREWVWYVLGPFYILIGLLLAEQYFVVGEVRYYAIKTAYLLEMLIIVLVVALLVKLATEQRLALLEQWLLVPVVVPVGIILVLSIGGANPLLPARQLLRQFNNFGNAPFYANDAQSYTSLALAGKLDGANTVDMHYDPNAGKISGISLLDSWVNTQQRGIGRTPETAQCIGTLYSDMTYGDGSMQEQEDMIAAARRCIALAAARHVPYYIITDGASVKYLQQLLGSEPVYVTHAIQQ